MYHPASAVSVPIVNLVSSIPTYPCIILKPVPGKYFSTLQINISAHMVKILCFAKLLSRKVFSM